MYRVCACVWQTDPAGVVVGGGRRGRRGGGGGGRGGVRDAARAARAHRAARHQILLRAHQDHTQPGYDAASYCFLHCSPRV